MKLPDETAKRLLAIDSWKVFRIISEFVDGFETMTALGPSVSIFGSARLHEGSPEYELGKEVARCIAEKGFAVITGGGPGIMEAANKGAQQVKGSSCGLSVDLPFEDEPNAFIDPRYRLRFRYFFVRKVMFIRYAQGYVFLPGGFGTLDELFEALTLIQTKKIESFPIYLMGSSYWEGLIDWIKKTALEHGCISEDDLHLITITDDPCKVAEGIERHYQQAHIEKNF
ncbi:MAG: TIGR00730 family Rossman fold protein [Chlamydiales bacterium]|nr:TIGR00730 family Rossman fold protein [Chlamydiia bacterium]MCP5507217.1 TIGR00730 family Rossman fold protein [Chlamydiales bacterium]